MNEKRTARQRIAPVVCVSDNQLGKIATLAKQVVLQQTTSLPMTFSLGQAEVPIHDVYRSCRGFDDGHLSSPRLSRLTRQLNLMMGTKRPSRQQQVAVSARLSANVELKHSMAEPQTLGKSIGLVVVPTATNVAIDFLKTNNVGIFNGDDVNHSVESVSTVSTTDSLVDVVAQHAHSLCSASMRVILVFSTGVSLYCGHSSSPQGVVYLLTFIFAPTMPGRSKPEQRQLTRHLMRNGEMSFDAIPLRSGRRIEPGAASAPRTESRCAERTTHAPSGNAVKDFLSRKQRQVPLGTKDNSPPIYRWVNRDNERESPVRDDRGSNVVSTSISFFPNLPSLAGLFGLIRYDNPPINRWAIVGSPYRDKNVAPRCPSRRPGWSLIHQSVSSGQSRHMGVI